ncbi:MAG: hypothetical protein L3K06_01340 [Thermoplasmata archaeon]|nr:hypothetical protein [Thermoplasmata archaeon]MCI4353994.1 hypothetical protein [Thermoplasmata archaeon]
MTEAARTIGLNVRWEITRLRRSQRGWLLLVPPIAAPIGSAIADLYLQVPSQATAQILGLLIAGGLAGLILLDLVALSVGEDLGLRAHVTFFALPQDRRALLVGRLGIVLMGTIAAYALAAIGVWYSAAVLVAPDPLVRPIFDPFHLALAIPAFLLFLAGLTAAGSVFTKTSAQGLVTGILGGVVIAGVTGYLLALHELTLTFPLALLAAGVASIGWAVWQYPTLGG